MVIFHSYVSLPEGRATIELFGGFGISWDFPWNLVETWLKPGCRTAVLRPPLILRRGTCTVPMPGRKLWRKHCFHGLHGLCGAETENQRIYDMDIYGRYGHIERGMLFVLYFSSGTQSMFLFLSTWVLRVSDLFGSRHHLFVCSNSGGKPPARDGVKDVNTTQCICIYI